MLRRFQVQQPIAVYEFLPCPFQLQWPASSQSFWLSAAHGQPFEAKTHHLDRHGFERRCQKTGR